MGFRLSNDTFISFSYASFAAGTIIIIKMDETGDFSSGSTRLIFVSNRVSRLTVPTTTEFEI